ncbi:unnamed protein product [Lota lota]
MKLSLCLFLFLTVLAPALGIPTIPSLSVTVSHASGLNGDSWFSKTDSYVKVSVGGTTRQTRTIWNNNSPSWQETLHFQPLGGINSLTLQVWDSDSGWFGGRDDFLGGCAVSILRGSHPHSCIIGRGQVYFSYTYSRFPILNLQLPAAPFPVQTATPPLVK